MRIKKAETHSLEDLLRAAAKEGDCYTIRRLVLAGVDIDSKDEQGFTAINYAAHHKQTSAMKTLLAAKEMRAYADKGGVPERSLWKNKDIKMRKA